MNYNQKYDPPPGYDNLNFDAESENCPTAPQGEADFGEEGEREILKVPTAPDYEVTHTPRTLTYRPPSLVYEDIYEACINYVKDSCCYGSKFVKQMTLSAISNGGVFHYTLDSFGEKRESALSGTPYRGQYIDGPENGPPPLPWDMVVSPPVLFQNTQVKVEIPHTAYVAQCGNCVGNGRVRCSSCFGRGQSSCSSCGGSGRRSGERCTFCHGSGHTRCWKCSGRGQVKCKRCDGQGRLKHCRMLIVTWINHRSEFISETFDLPPELIQKVTGSRMLFEQGDRVMPIEDAPDDRTNAASFDLINRHLRAFPNELIIKQRHILRGVPLTQASYQWKDKSGKFHVYGEEKKVYFDDYPQKCCCCTCL